MKREIGLTGAILMGLGSIVGTGVFVSIGIAAGVAGSNVLLAIFLASLLAIGDLLLIALALAVLALLAVLTLLGIKRTNLINSLIVGTTLVSLTVLICFGMPSAVSRVEENLAGLFALNKQSSWDLLHATALMFVAYTGYGRIATLGEEVKSPGKTIPRAMIMTLAATMLLYLSVGFVAVALVGPKELAMSAKTSIAPLLHAAQSLQAPWINVVLLVGAITAMLGVVLNLVLGLSRVALAMARRNDLPRSLSVVNQNGIPKRATILVVIIIGGLVLLGDVRVSWSFSAFTVLLYYSLTNLCAIRIEKQSRLYPVWISWAGLVGCLSLAFWVTPKVVFTGLIVLLVGLIFKTILRVISRPE